MLRVALGVGSALGAGLGEGVGVAEGRGMTRVRGEALHPSVVLHTTLPACSRASVVLASLPGQEGWLTSGATTTTCGRSAPPTAHCTHALASPTAVARGLNTLVSTAAMSAPQPTLEAAHAWFCIRLAPHSVGKAAPPPNACSSPKSTAKGDTSPPLVGLK